MNPVAELVISQIKAAFLYLPAGCVWAAGVGLAAMALGMVCKFCLHKKITGRFWWHALLLCVFVVYMYCIMQLTIFSRKAGNFGGIDWRFLARWSENNAQKAFLIANIIMFIPYGVILPMMGKWTKHILVSLPIAAASSIAIEAVQLKYQLGYCQLDDVAANSLGFLAGFFIYLMIADVYYFLHKTAAYLGSLFRNVCRKKE